MSKSHNRNDLPREPEASPEEAELARIASYWLTEPAWSQDVRRAQARLAAQRKAEPHPQDTGDEAS